MGLSSALTTALTGLKTAETQIDVSGNNLANSQTVGFKASDVVFATQFLRTLSKGSMPSENSGGTNPRQMGLGVQVAEITPDFTQGTIEASSGDSDLAIQGDGFFMVEGSQGEPLYTRNGIFKTNAENELVTATGNRLLGFGIDDFYNIEATELVPLTIPMGSAASAQATQNVHLSGNLTPTGDIADTAEVIQSSILGDGSIDRADITGTTATPVDGVGAGSGLTGTYSYLMTFSDGGVESRPSEILGPITVEDGRIDLAGLPAAPPGDGVVNIYRNSATDANDFRLVETHTPPPSTYSDTVTDSVLATNDRIDLDGPKINNTTLLTDIVKRDGLAEYQSLFEVGELTFTPRKGGNTLTEKTFTIEADTTVAEFLQFMGQASGIRTSLSGDAGTSQNNIPGESGLLPAGGMVTSDGRLRLVANNGTGNAIEINTAAFTELLSSGSIASPDLGFSSVQEAEGQSAVTDFVAYDSLGVPLDIRLTSVLESRDGNTTNYRWFADTGDNDPSGDNNSVAVGTGIISFDGEGSLLTTSNTTVNVDRQDIPSLNPLAFDLDFTEVSGFASETSDLAATRQDGSSAGTLTSYSVGESGLITGVFSNGISRDLGQVRLARFSNPTGLEQRGQNLYGVGFNSGLPMEGDPGALGLGSVVSGAVELSNTDIGNNLIDLLLASSQYRANSRVVSTSQELLDVLMNMR